MKQYFSKGKEGDLVAVEPEVLIAIGAGSFVLIVIIAVLVIWRFTKKKKINSSEIKENVNEVKAGVKVENKIKKQEKIKTGIKEVQKEDKPIFQIDTSNVIPSLPEISDLTKVDIKYPLIAPYAFAHIHWDKANTELVYDIEEPVLDAKEKENLETLEDGIRELINLSYISVKDKNTILIYLEKNVKILLTELSIQLAMDSYLKIMYYIYRDFVGLNEMEPLLNDYYIEDIECNGTNSPLYVVHRKYRNIRTNLVYPDIHKLASFVEKLAQKAGKYVSYAEPLLDGTLPDGSRINATYSTDISSKGPTFTCRKFTKEPWSPVQLLQKGTASAEILAYVWMCIEYENSFMVIGGTGSGKTSFLNAVAFFIPPQARIVSIEDTRELSLEHENWLPSVSRAGVGLTNILGQRYGEVSLFDLLKESFRQRPDYIIVGEVRGAEAYILFQGMASIRGDEEIFILNSEQPKRIAIKDLKENVEYKAITIDKKNNKAVIKPVAKKIVHPPRGILYKIITDKGREITVTADHSLFNYNKISNCITEIKAENIISGSEIVIAGKIPCSYANLSHLNLIEILPNIRVFAPELIKKASRILGFEKASRTTNVKTISDYYLLKNPSSMKSRDFLNLMHEAWIKDYSDVKVKFLRKSKSFDANIKLSDEFLRLLGYFISEGSLNGSGKNSKLSLYNKNEHILNDMRACILAVAGCNPKERITKGYGEATELSFSHKVLFELLKELCRKKERKIPDFIFGLNEKRIGQFLTGLYSGDGSFTNNRISYYTTSKKLANDIACLLLCYGIVAKINQRKREGRKTTDYEIMFYTEDEKNIFMQYAKPIGKKIKLITHKRKDNNKKVGDLYLDTVKAVEKIKLEKDESVYDISVPGTENFIGGFGGVVLHNSGHPSMGTMHAESVETMVRRLETPPINLSGSLIMSIAAVFVQAQTKVKGKEVRRMSSVDEVIDVKEKSEGGTVRSNNVFKWNPANDTFILNPNSHVFGNIAMHYGFTKEQVFNEFKLRAALLKELNRRGIIGFKEVQKIIHEYYKEPAAVLRRFNLIK